MTSSEEMSKLFLAETITSMTLTWCCGLIAAADRRMYHAKVMRDTVCASEPSLQAA